MSRFVAEAVLAVVGRTIVAAAFLAVLTLPYVPLVAAALLLWRILRRPGRVTPSGGAPTSAVAETLAGAINDVAANLPSLLGMALFARGGLAVLVVGVLLAVPLSWPVFAALVAGVALVGVPITIPPALGVLVPLAFAAVVLWRGGVPGWRFRRRPLQRPPQLPGV